jgi:hypothetical protein
MNGIVFNTHRSILPPKRYKPGLASTNAIPLNPTFFTAATWPCFEISCRHFHNCSCISILTGHTLLQLPQSDEANGKSANALLSKLGFSMEPIGPATDA